MEFGASIRRRQDADLGKKQLPRELVGRARIGDHEDRHAWLLGTPKKRPQPACLDIGRGKGFGEETDADAQDREPLCLIQMFRQPGNLKAEAMTRPIGGELIGLVGAGEHEGLCRERGRIVEGLAIKRVRLPAKGAVHFVEQEVVVEIGAQSLRRGDTDIDLVAQKRGGDRIQGRDETPRTAARCRV